ncbi:MAG TPA: MFS transporter [Terricaulis sp.]|nr:MFS transporter [Terricaulis sp.]
MHSGDPTHAAAEWRRSWPVVFTSAIGLSVSVIYIYSMGLFIEPIEAEFGWGRTQITAGLTVVSVLSVTLAPFVGMLIDRFGARSVGLPGVIIYCSAIAALSLVGNQVWMWWAGWAIVALGSVCIKPTVWTAAVASYFTAGRGLALALALCGTGIGQALLPYLTNQLVATFGWRAAYVALAGGGAAILLPLMLLFFFDAREEARRKGGVAADRSAMPGLELREGFISIRFIFLALAALLATGGITALLVHFVPMLSHGGMERSSAAAIAALIGLASMAGRILCGYLLDRFDGRVIGAISFALPCLACALFLQFDGGSAHAMALAIIIGLSVGAEIDVIAYLSTRYFGLRNFGALFGAIAGLISLGAGLGPLFAGAVFDATGGYALAHAALIPVFLVTAALMGSLGRYPIFATPTEAKA